MYIYIYIYIYRINTINIILYKYYILVLFQNVIHFLFDIIIINQRKTVIISKLINNFRYLCITLIPYNNSFLLSSIILIILILHKKKSKLQVL